MNLKLSIVNYPLTIFLLLFFALPAKAQVTIGAQKAPHSYSQLELAGTKGGVRLPMLNTGERDALKLTSDSTEAGGLVIYNTDIDCVEFWSDGKWIDLCSATPISSTVNSIVLSSAAGTNAQTVCDGAAITPVKYSTTGATGATVTGLPAGITSSWNADVVTISGKSTATGNYTYMVVLTGGSGSGTATGTITVNAPQLSAIYGNAVVEKGATNQTYYVTPVFGVTSYTWTVPTAVGTITDGQGTNTITVDASPTASAPALAGTISVTATNPCGDGPASTLDVTVGCGAYVSSKTDWREFMCYNLGVTNYSADPVNPSQDICGDKYKWGTGLVVMSAVDDQNPAYDAGFGSDWLTATYGGLVPTTAGEDWDMDTANPCPSGYRVPTDSEWSGVVTYNTISRTNISTWTASSNYTAGIYFGNLLFLPAAGRRGSADGSNVYKDNGFYWSSSFSSTPAALSYGFGFSSNGMGGISNKNNGMSVRCIIVE